jgi:hypothetical protein
MIGDRSNTSSTFIARFPKTRFPTEHVTNGDSFTDHALTTVAHHAGCTTSSPQELPTRTVASWFSSVERCVVITQFTSDIPTISNLSLAQQARGRTA